MPRPLAPTLGLIAIAGMATAADQWLKPEFSFGGFVETIGDVGNDSMPNDPTNSIDDNRWFADFLAIGGVYTNVRFNDHVGARVDVWLNPFGQSYADPQFRDGYLYVQDDEWTARGGREIRRLGWTSPHLDELYRVRGSTIGYTGGEPFSEDESVFGHDTLGVSLTWHRRDLPVQVTGMLNNGFWAWNDGGNGTRASNGRQRNGLGYGLDVAYIPDPRVKVAFQVAYDPRSTYYDGYDFGMRDGDGFYNNVTGNRNGTFRRSYTTADSAGDTWLIDLNATVKPVAQLTLGGEIARFTIGDQKNDGVTVPDSDYDRWQGLVMANWALANTRFPMSVTGMIQHIRAEQGPLDGKAWEYSAALLTQPVDRVPLHLDAELAYETIETDTSADSHGFTLSGRALLTF